ncbi:hypothetical protein HPP92_014045 [Vanilla planifolia]|uniref:Uncharacterized protein n=1 Tax=Vanilla planifolia TaxID=51239 RepID=A0A835QG50_VANPL|nr:hypothetical protein HPP92_014483 [Vanilla planifolia]KAG0474359.1 hypothetical protein HPP92_014045 [Vanilla planifolia]
MALMKRTGWTSTQSDLQLGGASRVEILSPGGVLVSLCCCSRQRPPLIATNLHDSHSCIHSTASEEEYSDRRAPHLVACLLARCSSRCWGLEAATR